MNLTKLLEVKNLSKSYCSIKGQIDVLNRISFDLYEKDFLGIVGPSGCGKSSILNIISSLDKEYNGKIILKENTKIGYMFQEDALFPWLSIYDNAILGLKISKTLTKENEQYVNNLLKKYRLYDFKDKYPGELSGGMKQRVALIRTISFKPELLLLDEPFAALDYQTRLSISKDVYELIKENNITAIIITHDISEAISLADRVIVLSKRPSHIKNMYEIKLDNKKDPISNRSDNRFSYYYELIGKDLDVFNE